MILDKIIFRRINAYYKLKRMNINKCIKNKGLRSKCREEVVCYVDDGLYPHPINILTIQENIQDFSYKQVLKAIEIIEKYIELDCRVRNF